MAMRRHTEWHRSDRVGWLRAAVLGANDGIVSTASLLVGIAAAGTERPALLLTGFAGLVAGAMAMAAGEYVSVHSQADSEQADLARERAELEADPASETQELSAIYVGRGLKPALAREVAEQLMRHDAVGAHARDELGLSGAFSARPLQAALASAASFAVGASLPLAVTAAAPLAFLTISISLLSIIGLAALGAIAARVGGSPVAVAAGRVSFWGALAMLITAAAGALFGKI